MRVYAIRFNSNLQPKSTILYPILINIKQQYTTNDLYICTMYIHSVNINFI